MRTVKVAGIAILTVGTAAVFVAVKAGLPRMSISNARLLPFVKYIVAAPPLRFGQKKTP